MSLPPGVCGGVHRLHLHSGHISGLHLSTTDPAAALTLSPSLHFCQMYSAGFLFHRLQAQTQTNCTVCRTVITISSLSTGKIPHLGSEKVGWSQAWPPATDPVPAEKIHFIRSVSQSSGLHPPEDPAFMVYLGPGSSNKHIGWTRPLREEKLLIPFYSGISASPAEHDVFQ